ncbi:MAG: ABC transporter permease, partial [Burkholderiales bacterium]
MHRYYEAASIALQAIWSNKLRAMLTVLGNVVAVTSIIAVVSLVQGLNANVTEAIQSGVGADAFTVQRTGIVLSDEQAERVQSNPRVTLDDAASIRRLSPSVAMVMAQANASTKVKYRAESLDSISIQGVTKEFNSLPTTNIERGRIITPAEFDAGRHVTVVGFDTADRLFGSLEPLGKDIQIDGVPFQVVGVCAQKGSIFGQSQDEFAVIPLTAFRHMFGVRPQLQLIVRPTDSSLVQAAMDEATVALRIQRRLRPKQPDNFGVLSSDTVLQIYNQTTAWIFAILIGVVSLSLVVGGIVIMNIMLMVVSERTREIGLRK